jgi:hypothetical protein
VALIDVHLHQGSFVGRIESRLLVLVAVETSPTLEAIRVIRWITWFDRGGSFRAGTSRRIETVPATSRR